MKVVYLADDFPPASFGGAGISSYEIAVGVAKAGHEVSVITACRTRGEQGVHEYDGLTVYKIHSAYHGRWRAWVALYNPRVVWQVGAILRQIQPDVVHANNVHAYLSYHCLALARRHARAVVWTARDAMAVSYGKLDTPGYLERGDVRLTWRDNLRQAGKRFNPVRNMLIRHYLRYADVRLAVSDALREVLEKNGIKNVETFHTGIDAQPWHVAPLTLAAFREGLGLAGKPVVLFGGRLNSGAQVLRAMRLVAAEMPEATLLVMGQKESAEHMQRESAGLQVVFTGWLSGEHKTSAYAVADVVWVPSTYFDAFPRSALEASAAGKPVVATTFGGAPELVVEGETGYVVNPLHAEEIAVKTVGLLRNPEKAAAMGRAGLMRVKTDFNITTKVSELIARYEALLGEDR